MPEQDDASPGRHLRVIWESDSEGPAPFANQFIIQHQRNEFYLSFGQLIPPAILGSQEDQERQLADLHHVSVSLLGRIAFTRDKMEELVRLLQENLETHDRTVARESPA